MANIGVIVPVYNVSQYLRRCIESILDQTYQDFELILIDDGSTDESGVICDEYMQRSKKVITIHQANCGLSGARNRGIEINENEYITFIDADDYIEKQYLETLYKIRSEHNADLVISGMRIVREGKKEARQDRETSVESRAVGIVNREEAYRYMLGRKQALLFAWGKLYHKKLFQKVRYPEGEIFEDVKVICELVERAERIVCTSYAGYSYVQRKDSITHGNVSYKHMVLLENESLFWSFIKEHYPDIEVLAKKKYFKSCFYLIERMASDPRFGKECRQLRRIILNNWHYLLLDRNVSWMERGGTVCLMFGVPCFRVVWNLYARLFYE